MAKGQRTNFTIRSKWIRKVDKYWLVGPIEFPYAVEIWKFPNAATAINHVNNFYDWLDTNFDPVKRAEWIKNNIEVKNV